MREGAVVQLPCCLAGGILRGGRQMFDTSHTGGGCTVDGAEHRAITVRQLKLVRAYVEKHCASEGWTETDPNKPKDPLAAEKVNLYHLKDYLIKPCTEVTQRSYVEFVASGPQDPKWFVSHWWGESVFDFVPNSVPNSATNWRRARPR